MKRLLTLIGLLIAIGGFSQQYNNEWIDFSKVYYKFKVGKTGLYRISQATLASAGLGDTPAEQFKLIRNGEEVPVYTTVPAGPLGTAGYIEFWGEANDGRADKPLYRDPAFQHSDMISLQTDTAMFFLTTGTGSHLRLAEQSNNVESTALPAEPFLMYTIGNHYKVRINTGFARNAGEYVYSSSYDRGEYWSSAEIRPATALTGTLSNLAVYTGGPAGYFRFGASGNAQNNRNIVVKLNNSQLLDAAMNIFNDLNPEPISFPVSLISGGTATVSFTNTSGTPTDRMVVSYYDITYPRKFDFGASRNFPFTLPAKSEGYHLSITNFIKGAVKPVLYDLTYGHRFTAVYSATGDSLKFLLPPASGERRLVLVNEEASNITLVTTLTPKQFIDYSNSSNQGDYLIISNAALHKGTNNSDPVAAYRDYRGSAAGGGYNVAVIDIDELVDQFAFGIKKHPLSIKNFLRFARDRFYTSPKNVFIIGKGVDYLNYRNNQSNVLADQLNLVPTFGYPGSDNFLSSPNSLSAIPVTPIGRLSVVHGWEIEDYLQKIIEYEDAQRSSPNTVEKRLWMKNIMHVTGASQSELGVTLCNFMHGYKNVLEDTLTGADVHMFCKSSANPVEQLSSDQVSRLFEEGISMLTYFGHSSTTTLEFNIDNPQNYNNAGKYPVFSVNGCNAGNFFTFYAQRLDVNETLSEKFVLAKQRGGIAFLASTHFGIVNYLNLYLNELYKNMSETMYGHTLGEINKAALSQLLGSFTNGDFFARCHSEEITLHGDPAIKMNFQEKPDYVIEDPLVKINPSFISIAESSFKLDVKMFNLGKAVKDSIAVEIKRQYPDGSIEVLLKDTIKAILYSDSISLTVPVISTRDKGSNKLIITLDADNKIDEMDEGNNSITKEFYVYEDEARPAFPYNFSIVSDSDQKFYISTANPLSTIKDYVVEIDTTELFNSSLKRSKQIREVGGIIEFNPQIGFIDSTVYYWRAALVPPEGTEHHWNTSSFIYIKGGNPGFNQSHYFQYLDSKNERISLNKNTRKWEFGSVVNNLFAQIGTWGTGAVQETEVAVSVNGNMITHNTCAFSSLVFNIFDPISFKPWVNTTNTLGVGEYGSEANNCYSGRGLNFEFRYTDVSSRKKIIDFMNDIIPEGAYVLVRSFLLDSVTFSSFPRANVNHWKADSSILGKGNTLYDNFIRAGFTDIDSFYRQRNFVYLYKKNSPEFTPKSKFTLGIYDGVTLAVDCLTPDTIGYITSSPFGPAKSWSKFSWQGKNEELNSNDKASVDIMGVDGNGNRTLLYTVDKEVKEKDISDIDAKKYPFLELRMTNQDSISLTPYQMDYWRVEYAPVPEGAMAPNLLFSAVDTLDIGEKFDFSVAFKNISQTAFDSLKMKLTIIDRNNVANVLPINAKGKPLQPGDSLAFHSEIDTRGLPENNILYINFNPDNDQPEQFFFNNFIYKDFYVRPDKVNPLLDVTFDGVHILNKDIVSAKPHIQIKVKDEAKFMLLNDTSIVNRLEVRYPDMNNTVKTYRFDNDTLRFVPAGSGEDNTATIDFSPYFPTILDDSGSPLNPEGDDYELIVKASDKSGNSAGSNEYRVSFRVINKPMISNLLNYPNPFTSSTAFVFTLTGSEIPQNIKIQILTITGKIVREITKEELGPIHIGRNITEFKWNGTDQYGQRLGNGVYLYRVVTTLNGKRMDKFRGQNDDTDKYFNKGYGKMYLMR